MDKIKKNQEDEKAEQLEVKRLEAEANVEHQKQAKVEAEAKAKEDIC